MMGYSKRGFGGNHGDKDMTELNPFVIIGHGTYSRNRNVKDGRDVQCQPCKAGIHAQCYSVGFKPKYAWCPCAKQAHEVKKG